MNALKCDEFFEGIKGQQWTTNSQPLFYADFEYGDGYIPEKNDFKASIDKTQVNVNVVGEDKVVFQSSEPLKPGFHSATLIFWPKSSFPQNRLIAFEVDDKPAVITEFLSNEKEGFYILFFDKVLNKAIAEDKSNWDVAGFNEGLKDIKLFNGGISTIVSFSDGYPSQLEAAPEIDISFNGSRGLSQYTIT